MLDESCSSSGGGGGSAAHWSPDTVSNPWSPMSSVSGGGADRTERELQLVEEEKAAAAAAAAAAKELEHAALRVK